MNQTQSGIAAINSSPSIAHTTSPAFSSDIIDSTNSSLWINRQESVVAIIPAFNEELVIASVILRTRMYLDNIIVVDDGSHDMTAELARLAGADVVSLPNNRGKGYAMITGFRHAQERNFTTFVMLDGDGQHDPKDIPALATPVLRGEADLVIGSRYLGEGSGTPSYRRVGQKVLDIFTNAGSTYRTTDSQSGFRALSRNAVENLDIASEGYSIESDMIMHLADRNMIIKEVPISTRYEVPHKHKQNPVTHGLGVLGEIVASYGSKRPIWFFGIPGATMTMAGIFGWVVVSIFYTSIVPLALPLTIASALAVLLGLLLITSGLILNSFIKILNNHRREMEDQ